MSRSRPGALVCADGTSFRGELWGEQPVSGELVFNTVMHGYQEVITDPSYAGQVVAFTTAHIGNYGVCAADSESNRPWCRGVVVADLARRRSNWRAEEDLTTWLARWGVPLLAGVDTRRLTRHLRVAGALPCAIGPLNDDGTGDDLSVLVEIARDEPGTTGVDLVGEVTTIEPYEVGSMQAGLPKVVVYDFGVKTSILAHLSARAQVTVVPAATPAREVLGMRPDGVVLSNGPGDPAALGWACATVKGLLGEVPILGICLGHQLLGAALGGETFKLPFGHHGGNHPVQRISDGSVQITSQNHNYAVDVSSLGVSGAVVTHVNLNDDVVEGFEVPGMAVMAVQYHPEAGPGPHDAVGVFDRFMELTANSGRAEQAL